VKKMEMKEAKEMLDRLTEDKKMSRIKKLLTLQIMIYYTNLGSPEHEMLNKAHDELYSAIYRKTA
jgi:hypothetical protein